MFGLDEKEGVLKEKISELSQELNLLVDELKSQRQKERELTQKIVSVTNDNEDYDHFYNDIKDIRVEEYKLSSIGEDDSGDNQMKNSIVDNLGQIDKQFDNDQELFEQDEAKVEVMEEENIKVEKELEQTTKNIIKIEEKIRVIEEKSAKLTKKIEELHQG